MKPLLLVFASLAVLFTSCKKTDNVAPPVSGSGNGIAVLKGTSVGVATNKTIGSSGGTLSSPDNLITVTVPAGAVSENTRFSVQQITNTAPNGIGTSYLLQPEGKHFEKPVTIRLAYGDEDLEGTYADALFAAYQDEQGIWHAKKNTVVNAAAGTVTVTTDHFSRWAVFANTRLTVDKPSIDVSESSNLAVKEVFSDVLNALGTGEAAMDTARTKKQVSDWSLTGTGILGSFADNATYFSPATAPAPNPVTVSVKVTVVNDRSGNDHSFVLRRKIYVNDSFLEIVLNGNTNIYPFAQVTLTAPYVVIEGHNAAMNGGRFTLLSGGGTGAFQWGSQLLGGTDVSLSIGGVSFGDVYADCAANQMKLTQGTVAVSKWTPVGGYVEGTLEGDVVHQTNGSCTYSLAHITGRFKAKRKL